jgi:hypothetical protein
VRKTRLNLYHRNVVNKDHNPSTPNQLDLMHKIIISGVHEIAALVAKIACVWWLGTMFVPRAKRLQSRERSDYSPESEATIVPRAKRFGIRDSGLPSVRIVSFAENSSSRERSDYSPESEAIRDSGLPSVRIVRPA